MALIEIHVVDAQTRERAIDLIANVLAREAALITAVAHRKVHLRREHQLAALQLGDDRAQRFFSGAASVYVGGIDEVHTEFPRAQNARTRRFALDSISERQPRSEPDRRQV